MTDNNIHLTTSVGAKRNFTGEISKLRRNQQVLSILVLLFVAVIFWMIVSLFSSQRGSKISSDVQTLAQPLNPAIDDAIFSDLEQRRTFSDEELDDFPIMIQVDKGKGEKEIVPLGSVVASPSPRPTTNPSPTPNPSLIGETDASPEPTPTP